jgi:hypothetical protein
MPLNTFVEGNGNLPESAEYQIFSINTHHQSSLTFQRTMDLASTCWSARSFWALITILSSSTVLYFAIWIRKALLSSLSIQQILESYSQASDSSSAIRNQCNDDHDLRANVTPKRAQTMTHAQLISRTAFQISDLGLSATNFYPFPCKLPIHLVPLAGRSEDQSRYLNLPNLIDSLLYPF